MQAKKKNKKKTNKYMNKRNKYTVMIEEKSVKVNNIFALLLL